MVKQLRLVFEQLAQWLLQRLETTRRVLRYFIRNFVRVQLLFEICLGRILRILSELLNSLIIAWPGPKSGAIEHVNDRIDVGRCRGLKCAWGFGLRRKEREQLTGQLVAAGRRQPGETRRAGLKELAAGQMHELSGERLICRNEIGRGGWICRTPLD